MTIREQFKRNQLAIISVLVALTALGYNTWRNELTEQNRTVRHAGFEMLIHVGQLRRISYLAHYDNNRVEGNPRHGWTEVLLLQDLATLMPEPVRASTSNLAAVWGSNWEKLGADASGVQQIDIAIDKTRESVLQTISTLD